MRADVHLHSNFSHDSDASPEQMILGAMDKGLEMMCFTDHYDKDNMEWGPEDIFEPEKYFQTLLPLQEKYRRQMDVRIGVEIGLGQHLGDYYREFVKKYPFDFVIGSVHCVGSSDIAKRDIFRGRSDEEVYRIVFEETLAVIQKVDDFDVLGHLDYVVRYGERREAEYSYQKFSDVIDEILRILIAKGKGLELNMAGIKYGLSFAHPHTDVLKRYRELGGEIITVGADGHKPEHIAYDFSKVTDILQGCGFKYYAEYSARKPVFKRVA